MTPEQQTALLEACRESNDVRIVTIALQVAANCARNKRQEDAIAIRNSVDAMQVVAHREKEYRKIRLEVAARLYADPVINCDANDAVRFADSLIKANNETPIP